MGYTTNFKGKFKVSTPLNQDQINYLEAFSSTRRMRRDEKKLASMPDPIRKAVGLPVGFDGEYYVGGSSENFGQNYDKSVLDNNQSPSNQPGLWCDWTCTEDGKYIQWNGSEKFYYYNDWLHYLIDHFLTPWGKKLNGKITWKGEDRGDKGVIVVEDNVVSMFSGEDYKHYLQNQAIKKEKKKLDEKLPKVIKKKQNIRI